MPQDCPEFARGGGGRGGGVKAIPMHRERSPRPGGIRGGIKHDEHLWGLRRGVDTADGGLVGMRRRSKWGGGFVWQDAGGKSVSARDCPEFQWGKAEGSRLNAKVRNNGDCIAFVFIARSWEDSEVGHRGILTLDLDPNQDLDQSGRARTLKENLSESGGGFILEEIGGEWVMREDCPEFPWGKAEAKAGLGLWRGGALVNGPTGRGARGIGAPGRMGRCPRGDRHGCGGGRVGVGKRDQAMSERYEIRWSER